MKSFLIIILFLAASFEMSLAGNKDYRDYLTSVDGFNLWFRIGSYSLNVNGASTPVDLYYYDSDIRPDGAPVQLRIYPNSFGLYCVWRDTTGEWHHKEVARSARCTFHRIVSAETDRIELEIRPKFMVKIDPDVGFVEQSMRVEEINKPHLHILAFRDGIPTLSAAEPTKAEQGGADQPATAPELKTEGSDKPQPESKPAPR